MGTDIFKHLLSPTFLANTRALQPGGMIHVKHLATWTPQAPQCPLLTDGSGEEEYHEHDSKVSRELAFPSRELTRVLHVGCGNSRLGEYMLHEGFTNIVNVDYSEVVIKKSKFHAIHMPTVNIGNTVIFSLTFTSSSTLQTLPTEVQEKYNSDFFLELHSCLEKEETLRNSLGLVDSRDDKSHYASPRASVARNMTFECGDVTEGLNYPDEAFDLIICKKTLDVILCGAGSKVDAASCLSECFRLLNKDHGGKKKETNVAL